MLSTALRPSVSCTVMGHVGFFHFINAYKLFVDSTITLSDINVAEYMSTKMEVIKQNSKTTKITDVLSVTVDSK